MLGDSDSTGEQLGQPQSSNHRLHIGKDIAKLEYFPARVTTVPRPQLNPARTWPKFMPSECKRDTGITVKGCYDQ